jgi:hypothetical protein
VQRDPSLFDAACGPAFREVQAALGALASAVVPVPDGSPRVAATLLDAQQAALDAACAAFPQAVSAQLDRFFESVLARVAAEVAGDRFRVERFAATLGAVRDALKARLRREDAFGDIAAAVLQDPRFGDAFVIDFEDAAAAPAAPTVRAARVRAIAPDDLRLVLANRMYTVATRRLAAAFDASVAEVLGPAKELREACAAERAALLQHGASLCALLSDLAALCASVEEVEEEL